MNVEDYTYLFIVEDPFDECSFMIHPSSIIGLNSEEVIQLYNAVMAMKRCRLGHPVPYFILVSIEDNLEFFTLYQDRFEVLMIIEHQLSGHNKYFYYKTREEKKKNPVPRKMFYLPEPESKQGGNNPPNPQRA